MTPAEALDLLNRAASKVAADRETHQQIIEAVNILDVVVAEASDASPDD